MAYGIAINTIFGLKNITSERVPRFVADVLIPGSAGGSGSFTAPGGTTSSNGFAFSRLNSTVIVSISGSTVSWAYALTPTQFNDFNITIVRFL